MNLRPIYSISSSFHPEHKADLLASGLDLKYAYQAGVFTLPPDDVGKVLGACGWGWAAPQVNSVLVFLYPETDYWRCKLFPPPRTERGRR